MPSTRGGATKSRPTCRSARSCRSWSKSSLEKPALRPAARTADDAARRSAAIRAARRLGARTPVAPGGGQGGAVDGLPLLERRAALAERHGSTPRAPHPRPQAAPRAPANGALRGDARAARSAAGARLDRDREPLSQLRGIARRRARLHAGDALLGEAALPAVPQSVSPAHQPRVRLSHLALLSRPGEGRLLPGARAL